MEEEKSMGPNKPSRRKFVKDAVYVAPAILTLTAVSSFASAGSRRGIGGGTDDPRRDRFFDWLQGLWR